MDNEYKFNQNGENEEQTDDIVNISGGENEKIPEDATAQISDMPHNEGDISELINEFKAGMNELDIDSGDFNSAGGAEDLSGAESTDLSASAPAPETEEPSNLDITEFEVNDADTGDLNNDDWSEPKYKKSEDESVYSPNRYGEKKGYSTYAPVYEEPKGRSAGGKRTFGATVAVFLVFAIVCSLFSGLAAYFVTDYKINKLGLGKQVVIGNQNVTATAAGDNVVTHTGEKLTGTQIYNMAQSQVVGVNTEITTNIFGQYTSNAVSGTGFVISEDGYILTNYHVIEYAANYDYELKVMFYDGKEYTAQIIGYEEANDVAVIKIDASGLNPVTFGDSDSISVGETIYPIGNPLGELTNSMTTGIISALDRVIATDASTKINMFQIDAAVNKGNSGGPVYNEYGEVLGIVTAKYSETGVEGLGFAIPINDVLDIVSQLISTGYVGGKAALGVVVQTMDSSFASYYNVPQGAYIREITANSCAAKAGLRIGDIIVAFNDEKIESKEDLIAALRKCSAGDTVKLKIHRAGNEETVSVTLDEKQPTSTSQG